MRTLRVEHNHHLWVFDRIKHKWFDIAHNKIKPNDIFVVFKNNWKTICDYCGESVLYCKSVNLEDTGSTIMYTPLKDQLEFLSQEDRNEIIAERSIYL